MKAADMMKRWQAEYGEPRVQQSWPITLNVKDAARVEALLEMFPGLTRERLLSDLVHAALNDLTSSFPYVEGDTVIGQDEDGFPMYEDAGKTPTFLALTRKHLDALNTGQH
ncbi:hypothetical protein [Oceanobacter mangrovi]|uniref:hypothetical protein n=1 Tax=Oceanobacter mangrovi TaxID=2862510 RepID=UPI001C8E1AF7|nr:hypothetical protein [Oceanobacter mangrovi]